jgi:hypothetical protein
VAENGCEADMGAWEGATVRAAERNHLMGATKDTVTPAGARAPTRYRLADLRPHPELVTLLGGAADDEVERLASGLEAR